MRREREEKKRYLLRKLSFRPSVEELKNRKVGLLTPTKYSRAAITPRINLSR